MHSQDTESPKPTIPSAISMSPPNLSLLNPVKLKPNRPTKQWHEVIYLQAIESIQIEQCRTEQGKVIYLLNIYLYQQNTRLLSNIRRLTKHYQSHMDGNHREPDYQIQRSFDDFCVFRHTVADSTCMSYTMMNFISDCKYCRAVCEYLDHELTQPTTLTKWVVPGSLRIKILTDFINDFVHFAQERREHHPQCKCVVMIPQLLETLLAREDEDVASTS